MDRAIGILSSTLNRSSVRSNDAGHQPFFFTYHPKEEALPYTMG